MMAMNDQHIYRHIKLHKKNIIGNHQIKNKNHFRSLRAYDTMYMYDIWYIDSESYSISSCLKYVIKMTIISKWLQEDSIHKKLEYYTNRL